MPDLRLDGFELQCGQRVASLHVRFELHGRLSPGRDNAVLFPTWFAGRHAANPWVIGPGRGLDTNRWCVIVVDALGNGESASPSNTPALRQPDGMPVSISLLDQAHAQRAVVESLGVARLHAIVGRSMGAQQALQWACLWPGMLGRVFAFCGLPRTTPHNRLLLEGMAEVLRSGIREGRGEEAVVQAAAIYAPWTLSHAFFNEGLWSGTAPSAAKWVDASIRQPFAAFEAQDLLSLVQTWQAADISANDRFGGDLSAALRAIRVPVMLAPISSDLIFPPADFAAVHAGIEGAQMQVLESKWGHRAGAPGTDPADVAVLEQALRGFLGS